MEFIDETTGPEVLEDDEPIADFDATEVLAELAEPQREADEPVIDEDLDAADELNPESVDDEAEDGEQRPDEDEPEEKRLKIFISYNHNDNDTPVAQRIYEELSRNYDVFRDVATIVPGQIYEDVTEDWLNTCDVVIALISAVSVKTNYIKAELQQVYDRYNKDHRPIVLPVHINYTGPTGLRLGAYIGHFQAVPWDNNDYAWLFERLYAGLGAKLPPITKAVIVASDIIPITKTLQERHAAAFIQPRGLIPVSFEEKRLLWVTGDAAVRNYVAVAMAAAEANQKSLYEITKGRKWSEINSTLISDSIIVLRDALPAEYLEESGAIGEWHSLRSMIERNNIIIATAPENEFDKLRQELLRYQFTDYQHREVNNNSYPRDSKLMIFSHLIEHLFEKGEFDEDKYAWACELAKDPNDSPPGFGAGRDRAIERRRRDMQRKFRENIGRWSPDDIERFALNLPQVTSEADIAKLLQRSAALEDEIRSWFVGLDDSTQCFLLTLALFGYLDQQALWNRYKSIVEHLRQFDNQLRLLPFGICRKLAHPYVSLDGPLTLDDRVAEAIREEIARSYREYFIELTGKLKDWSVPPGHNAKTLAERSQRKRKIEETKEARTAITRMVGTAARFGLEDLTEILDYWATDSDIEIRKSVAFALELTAKSPTGVSYALNLLERWCEEINSNGRFKWRAMAAAHALGFVTAAAKDSYVTDRALRCLRAFAKSRRPDARFYASIALRQVARYAPLTSTEGALARLAKDERPNVRLNVAAALNEAHHFDAEAADTLIDSWIRSADPKRRWVALCGIVINSKGQNSASRYERLIDLLEDEDLAMSLASVIVETIAVDYYEQIVRDTFSYLVVQTKERAWDNLAAALGTLSLEKLEEFLLPLLHFDTAPLFNERAIEVRREILKDKLDEGPAFLSILKTWLGRKQIRLEVYRALLMLVDESAAGERPRFISAMAKYFADNPGAVNDLLSSLVALAPADFALLSRAVSREAFRCLLHTPERFLTITRQQVADEKYGVAALDALDALAAEDQPESRDDLLSVLLIGYAQTQNETRNLLAQLRSSGSLNLISAVREFNYRVVETAMSNPAQFPSVMLELLRADIETLGLLNYLATPEPQGQRRKMVQALVEARLSGVPAAEEFLALPALKEWLHLASLPGEVARSFYVRRIFRPKFVKRLFIRKPSLGM